MSVYRSNGSDIERKTALVKYATHDDHGGDSTGLSATDALQGSLDQEGMIHSDNCFQLDHLNPIHCFVSIFNCYNHVGPLYLFRLVSFVLLRMIGSLSSSPVIEHVHRSTPSPISTLQHQRMAYLSSLSYLSDWPIDIIRIVADYMSIQLWIALEEYSDGKSTLMVLNFTSLQTEMKNNTFKYISVPLTSDSSNSDSKRSNQPFLRKGASPTLVSSLNLAENDGIMTTTSEWHRWTSK
jgi:hypothetical protein